MFGVGVRRKFLYNAPLTLNPECCSLFRPLEFGFGLCGIRQSGPRDSGPIQASKPPKPQALNPKPQTLNPKPESPKP